MKSWMKPRPERKKPSLEILRYLESNPDALDTADGIARWWIGMDLGVVEPSLQKLTFLGILQRRVIGGQIYYSLNPIYRGMTSKAILKEIKGVNIDT